MFNLEKCVFLEKAFPLIILSFRRAFYKPGCVLKESRTNCLLGLGEHADDIWFGKWKEILSQITNDDNHLPCQS
jgi:hypothetical protein